MGYRDNENSVYIVDFGIARRYKNPRNGAHMVFSNGKPPVVTFVTQVSRNPSPRCQRIRVKYSITIQFSGRFNSVDFAYINHSFLSTHSLHMSI